jgi:PEGA domain/Tetratricopeptide repeat
MSSRRAMVLLSMVICAVFTIITSPALAQPGSSAPPPEARERFGRGIDLYDQGDYGGALAEFKRAYELAPYSVILYNLGLTYAALGRPVEAADALDKVLANPGSLSADRVSKAKAMRAEQAARIAEVTITSNVDGASIEIDGVVVAKTPLAAPLKIKGGPRRIGAVLTGHVPQRKEIDIAAGSRAEVRFDLIPTDARLAHLTVKTKLPGATVVVDGETVGTTPLASSITLLPGSRRIELRRPGYITGRNDLTLGDGATAEVSFDLEEDPAALRAEGGSLRLDIAESQAVITIDGKPRGVYLAALELAPGAHRLRVERGGFMPVERDVIIQPRTPTTLRIELEPTAETRSAYVSKASTFRTLGLIGTIGGAVIAGAGGVFLGINAGEKDETQQAILDFNARELDSPTGRCNMSITAEDAPYCQNEQKRLNDADEAVRSRDTFGYIGLGVGGAALVGGVIFLIVGDDPTRYDRRPIDQPLGLRIVPSAEIGRAGGLVGLSGVF